ncbi:MAG: xanthine dehydrogenase family protein molybdopterin-binding subunit [Deltaproteobacteria bacterium]|nr:xanthine dehydrogenase family protein molybdopterin-binding subunit [Deltaproteobacteria bacterium]
MSQDTIKKVLELVDNIRADQYPLDAYTHIGRRGIRRIDGVEKANGAAIYTMDVHLPGMLFMRFLTSPHPHARVVRLDTSRAESLPGVRVVLRYDDPELPPTADLGGHFPSSEPPIPHIAYFEGQEIGAAIAAETEEIAEQALKLIRVEWEQRPFLLDPEKAAEPGAPLTIPELFPNGNVYNEGLDVHQRGDVEKGLREADRVIEFQCRRSYHTWIGPERPCGVFKWNGDYPEVWVKQQRPHICKRAIATWFGGIPTNRIQLHCLYQGASFGGWSQMHWNLGGTYCAAVAARRTRRPVKWLFTRREDFYGAQADAGFYSFTVGARKDGTITAVKAKAVMSNQDAPVFGIIGHLMENTRIPNLYGKLQAVMINKGPTVPVRCEQAPNTLALTMVFDHVANALGLDPIDVALKNDGAEGHDMGWLNKQKEELSFPVRDSLRECIDKGKAAIGWDAKRHRPGERKLSNGRMHGLAFTWTHEWEDSAGSSEIAIRIERSDGTASILGMRADGGQNAETSYCQIAADELGMRVEDVYYRPQHDTGFFPHTPDSSTNLAVNGFAIRNAARILKRRILEAATSPRGVSQRGNFPAPFPGLKPEDLDIQDSVIYVKADPAKRMSLAEYVGPLGIGGPMSMGEMKIGHEQALPRMSYSPPLFAYGWQVQEGAYAHIRLRLCRQAHFMEVEVDTETGEVEITRVVNVNDVGKVISWEGCEAQQYGGTFMAVGRARSEEVVHDPATGVMLNGNLLDYKIATMLDCGPVDTILVETGMGYGPYGTVGIGEDVATVLPPLLGPAVYNALGVWVDDFPITPDKILRALGKTA